MLVVIGCSREGSETADGAAEGSASTPPAGSSYQVVNVGDGGRIVVTVMTSGQPEQVTAEVTRDQETCGTTIHTPLVEVGRNGVLKNAVVFIDNISRGKAPDVAAAPRLDNRGCRFLPYVQTVTAGQMLDITNSDPILHNTHAYLGEHTVFNLALPTPGVHIAKKITDSGLMRIQCDAGHTWMEAWIYVFPHPYHTTTGDDGRGVLTDVPPGTYQVTAWHPKLGTQTQSAVIGAGKEVELTMAQLEPSNRGTSP